MSTVTIDVVSEPARARPRWGWSVRHLREQANLSLVEVAEAVGTSASYLWRVEIGALYASPQFFGRMAAAIAFRVRVVKELQN
jgi:transcriptional regulator with XRE-family HTH domain